MKAHNMKSLKIKKNRLIWVVCLLNKTTHAHTQVSGLLYGPHLHTGLTRSSQLPQNQPACNIPRKGENNSYTNILNL